LYPSHKAYVRDVILSEKPEITVDELAIRLNMPKGEAHVILTELAQERTLKA
jgi:DNA-binding IclR family transcriptional regulator